MTTISTSVQQSLPRVSYIKAMDVWAFSCLFFVCASLLEISIVNVMVRKERQRLQKLQQQKKTHAEADGNKIKDTELDSMLVTNATDNTHDDYEAEVKEPTNKYERIHVLCRILFPAAFALFNALYWWYYLSMFAAQVTFKDKT